MGPSFVDYVLTIVNVDRCMWVIEESVQATPTPLKGKDASFEQSVEGAEPKAQHSMAAPATEEDTHPKVLIRGEWRKVPDS